MSQRNRVLSRAAILTIVCAICVPAGCTDTVTEVVAAASVAIQPSTGSVDVGSTLDLQATVRDGSGHVLTGRSVGWSSSAPSVASVDDAGTVRGVAPGAATITATAAGVSGTANVTVLGSSLAITPDSLGFTATVGGPDPASRTVSVSATGSAPLSAITLTIDYGAGQPSGWLNASVSSTTTPLVLTLHASSSGLEAGTYSGIVRVAAPGAADTAGVDVTLTVSTAPPGTPSNLVATVLSQSRVDLSWTDNATSETRFRVERKSGGGGTWSVLRDSLPANTTSFSDTGLTAGNQYHYRVQACAGSLCSAYSGEAVANVETPPSAPSNLTVAAVSASTVSLTWIDNSGNESRFRVERAVNGGTWVTVSDSLSANTSAFDDNTVSAVTSYSYRVQACNAGGCSAFSAEAYVTTPPPPTVAPNVPTSLVASSTQFDQAMLSWTDASDDESKFQLARRRGGVTNYSVVVDSIPANATTYTDTGLVASTQYDYAVRACNSAGCSNYSAPSSVTTAALPAVSLAPSAVTFTGVQGGANPAGETVAVTNGGESTLSDLSTSISYGPGATGWLTAGLSATTAPATLTLSAAVGSLTPGTYSATVHVAAAQASNSPQDVAVTFTVSQPPPAISLSPASVSFSAVQGTGNPSSGSVSVTNGGGGSLTGLSLGPVSYQAGESTGWLSATLVGGSAPASVTLSPTTGALVAGTYHASVQVFSSAAGVSNSPQTISVTFQVAPAAPTLALSTSTVSFTITQGTGDPAAADRERHERRDRQFEQAERRAAFLRGRGAHRLAQCVHFAVHCTCDADAFGDDGQPDSGHLPRDRAGQLRSHGRDQQPPDRDGDVRRERPAADDLAEPQPGLDVDDPGIEPGGRDGVDFEFGRKHAGRAHPRQRRVRGRRVHGLARRNPGGHLGAGEHHTELHGRVPGRRNVPRKVPVQSTATGVTNSPDTLDVTLTVNQPPPTIGLSPASRSFTAVQGGPDPASQTVGVTNTGGGTLDGLSVGAADYPQR